MAVAAIGCGGSTGADYGCPELPACGGNPAGVWTLENGPELGSYCQYIPPLSYTVGTLTPPMTATQSPTAQVTPKSPGDGCSDLVYEPQLTSLGSHIKFVTLPHGTGTVQGVSSINLKDTHEYSAAIRTLSTTTTVFSRACMDAYGAHPSCSDLEAGFIAYVTAMPNYLVGDRPFDCTPMPDTGCSCVYQYEGTAADDGTWQVSGDILYFFTDGENPGQSILPTTFCVNPGHSLSITGRDGLSLFNTKGLRSLTFVPSTM